MLKTIDIRDEDEIKDAVAEVVPIFDRTEFGKRVLKEDFEFKNDRVFVPERKRYSEALKRKCAAKREKAIAERKAREAASK